MAVYYESPPMKIGNHDWRCVVKDYPYAVAAGETKRCTDYQFRRRYAQTDAMDAFRWQSGNRWPGYERNHNNADGGMPKSLNRLFAKYRREIEAALVGFTVPPEPMLFA